MRELNFESFDGSKRQLLLWDSVKRPNGVLVIIHGMAEHASRYSRFSEYLNAQGIIAAALEQRAHKGSEILGHEDGDVFGDTVKDNLALIDHMRSSYNLPVSVFGHSYGSMIAQSILQNKPDINCMVLSGSAARTDFLARLGYGIAKLQRALFGGKKRAKLIDKLTFGAFDKPFGSENRKFAWLSRDKECCEQYIGDAFCGYPMSLNFQASFLGALKGLYTIRGLSEIDKDLPVMIISGDKDPVGGNGKFVEELYGLYLRNGLRRIKYKLYKDARHEILNETNRDEVYRDVVSFVSTLR